MKYKIILFLLFASFQIFAQLDYKLERKIKQEEDSLRKADTDGNFIMIKRVKYGFLTAFSQGNTSVMGLGVSRLVTNSVGHAGAQLNYEKILNNRFQGMNVGLFAAAQGNGTHLFSRGGIFNQLYGGINAGFYSDLSSTNFFCVKPEIGFQYGHFILTYSYTWTSPQKNRVFQNTHAVNFKYYLTFYRKKKGRLYRW